MIAVCIIWSTDADGEPIDIVGIDFDDLPRSYYGPFNSMSAAISWMDNDYPDGVSGVYDMQADVYDIPLDYLNDPESVICEDVGPESREIHGS